MIQSPLQGNWFFITTEFEINNIIIQYSDHMEAPPTNTNIFGISQSIGLLTQWGNTTRISSNAIVWRLIN